MNVALATAMKTSATDPGARDFGVPIAERQLFLDDFGVAEMTNLARTMHMPAKKGAVIRPDISIGQYSIQMRTGPDWDEQKQAYILWDCAGSPEDLEGVTGCYESADGLHWSKPVLNQIEFRGSRANNFTTVEIHGLRKRIDYVVHDPIDPDPSRRYKGWVAMHRPAGGYAPVKQPVISDGFSWQVLDVPAIPSDIHDGNLSFDHRHHTFIGGLEVNGPFGRSWAVSCSNDFERWTEPELVFHADELDQALGREHIEARLSDSTRQEHGWVQPVEFNVNVYNMGIFRYESVYVGLPSMFHATGKNPHDGDVDGFNIIQLTCSRDLKDWIRLGDRQAFIEPSQLGSGAYDLTQILGPGSAVVRNDELWFYYTGLKYRGIASEPNRPRLDPDSGGICLAVLRRDGFASLDASGDVGTVTTRRFELRGTRLFVNADAAAGELRVEALDVDGAIVARSVPVSGDQVCAELTWESGELAHFREKGVSFRFTLRDALLYSYWFE